MSATHVQSVGSVVAASSTTLTLTSVAAGDLIVVGVRSNSGTPTCTDTVNTYTAGPTVGTLSTFYVLASAAATNLVITVTGVSVLKVGVDQFSGGSFTFLGSSTVASASNTTSSVTFGSIASIGGGNVDWGVAIFTATSGTNTAGTTNGVSMTTGVNTIDATNGTIYTEYALSTASGTQNATATCSANTGANAAQIAFGYAATTIQPLLQYPFRKGKFWTPQPTWQGTPSLVPYLPTAYNDAVVTHGANHFWPMQEASGNIVDIIGSANGVPSGTLTYRQPGPRPELFAIQFDGATSQFNCGSSPFASGMFTLNDNSIEGWAYIDKTRTWPDAMDEIIAGGGATTNDQYPNLHVRGMSTRPATEAHKAHWAKWGTSVNSADDTVEGVWYHIVGTYSNSGIVRHVYVNGVESGSIPLPGGPGGQMNAPLTSNFIIGFFNSAGGQWFKGFLCRVATYPLVLTPAQVLSHYLLGQPVIQPQRSLPVRPGGFWQVQKQNVNGASSDAASGIVIFIPRTLGSRIVRAPRRVVAQPLIPDQASSATPKRSQRVSSYPKRARIFSVTPPQVNPPIVLVRKLPLIVRAIMRRRSSAGIAGDSNVVPSGRRERRVATPRRARRFDLALPQINPPFSTDWWKRRFVARLWTSRGRFREPVWPQQGAGTNPSFVDWTRRRLITLFRAIAPRRAQRFDVVRPQVNPPYASWPNRLRRATGSLRRRVVSLIAPNDFVSPTARRSRLALSTRRRSATLVAAPTDTTRSVARRAAMPWTRRRSRQEPIPAGVTVIAPAIVDLWRRLRRPLGWLRRRGFPFPWSPQLPSPVKYGKTGASDWLATSTFADDFLATTTAATDAPASSTKATDIN